MDTAMPATAALQKMIAIFRVYDLPGGPPTVLSAARENFFGSDAGNAEHEIDTILTRPSRLFYWLICRCPMNLIAAIGRPIALSSGWARVLGISSE